jgi:hypothetical protein
MCAMTAMLIPLAVEATRRLVETGGPNKPRTRRR